MHALAGNSDQSVTFDHIIKIISPFTVALYLLETIESAKSQYNNDILQLEHNIYILSEEFDLSSTIYMHTKRDLYVTYQYLYPVVNPSTYQYLYPTDSPLSH